MDKFGLYNLALSKGGAERLTQTEFNESTQERDLRLDDVYESSLLYCLQVAKPFTSSKVVSLTTRSANDYGYEYDLPDDYIELISSFANADLDQELGRSFIQGKKLVTDSKTPFIRYIADSVDVEDFSPTFVEVVATYLSHEIAPVFFPDRKEELKKDFEDAVSVQLEINAKLEKDSRVSKSEGTLTNSWKHIYNDALQILGKQFRITSLTDTSEARDAFQTALSNGLILSLLEGEGWHWAKSSYKMTRDPSLEPEWGRDSVFEVPEDMVRLIELFCDEYFHEPIKIYNHERDHIFVDGYDYIYIQYISSGLVSNPDAWPPTFRRYVAAKLAEETAGVLMGDWNNALRVYAIRKEEAEETDAMQSPPELIPHGSWRALRHSDNYSGYDTNKGNIPNADC